MPQRAIYSPRVILTEASNASEGFGCWPPDSFAPAKPVPASEIAKRYLTGAAARAMAEVLLHGLIASRYHY
jgi:hypothetical protein